VYDFASQFEGKGENTFETALIVLRYFQVNFDYDYEMWFGTSSSSGPSQDQDWVEWFLQRRKGISIHFATAYIITLRILGISARLVFGFLPGEESRGSRIIKNKHLHFWAEVWIPIKTDSGVDGVWVAFDPSPPGYLEALNTERDQFVINPRYTLTITSSHENVTRGVPVNLTATLLSDGEPLPYETITFTDIYDSLTLNGATSVTNESGVATLTFNFTDDSLVGSHIIVANWKLLNNQTTIILAGNTTITVTVTPDEVARTEVARISGVLSDAKNERGLPDQEITIIWEGKNFSAVFHTTTKSDGSFSFSYTVPLSHPLGNATVYAIYDGNFTSLISSSSNTTNVTVVAKVKFTVSVTPNEVRRNETIVIEGLLLLDNNTPLNYQNITIYWDNSTRGGKLNILKTIKTNESGGYNLTITIPANHSLGFSYVFSGYNPIFKYVRSSNSTKSQILIYERVFVYVNVSSTRVGRNNSLTVFGNITGEDNEPIGNATIQVFFNNTNIGAGNKTNMKGQFITTFTIPSDFEVGIYTVRVAVSNPPWFKGSGEYTYVVVYGFSNIRVEGSPLFVLPGEQLNVTGLIVDERGDPVQNAEIQVIFNKTLLTVFIGDERGSFGGNITIPDVSSSNLTLTFLYEKTEFYNASTTIFSVLIFKNASITIIVNNTNYLEAYPGEGLIITGSVVDEQGRYIVDREVELYVNDTVQLIYLDKEGNFTVFYMLPEDVNPGNMTIYATLKAKTHFKSNEVIVLVKVREQRMWRIHVPLYLLYILVVAVFAVSSMFLFFKKFWKGIRKRKKPEIDLSSPIMAINDYVRQAKFKEAIIEAYNLFEKIIRAYFNTERPGSLTPREFAINVVKEFKLNPDATYILIKMFEKARFSHHDIGLEDYNSFVKAFSTIYRQVTGRAFELAQK